MVLCQAMLQVRTHLTPAYADLLSPYQWYKTANKQLRTLISPLPSPNQL